MDRIALHCRHQWPEECESLTRSISLFVRLLSKGPYWTMNIALCANNWKLGYWNTGNRRPAWALNTWLCVYTHIHTHSTVGFLYSNKWTLKGYRLLIVSLGGMCKHSFFGGACVIIFIKLVTKLHTDCDTWVNLNCRMACDHEFYDYGTCSSTIPHIYTFPSRCFAHSSVPLKCPTANQQSRLVLLGHHWMSII